MKKLVKILFLFLFVTSHIASAQDIVYVDPLASGNQTGTSWANAYTNIIDAIDNASQGSEIWVTSKAAVYVSKNHQQTDKIIIDKDLRLYGGFAGSETSKEQRISHFRTTISGSIGIVSTSDDSHNAFVVKADVTLDGFNFRYFNSGQTDLTYYGVITADTGSQVTLSNVYFMDNLGTGRGVCISALQNSIVNCNNVTVQSNLTSGSMIVRNDNAKVIVDNSNFSGNGTDGSGYIFNTLRNGIPGHELNEQTLLTVRNSMFQQNTAAISYSHFGSNEYKKCTFRMKGSFGYNFNVGDSATFTIDSCTFTGSYSSSFIYTASGLKNFTFSNSSFQNSMGEDRYFFDISAQNISFSNSEFYNLKGSIPFYSSTQDGEVTIDNCHFNTGTASSYFLYIAARKFICTHTRFNNITSSLGSYLSIDSAYFSNDTFQQVGNYSFLPLDYIKYTEIDSCTFSGIYQSQVLFRTSAINTLIMKNSSFASSSISNYNPGLAFLFTNWGGNVTLINNRFEQVFAYGNMIRNTGNMTLFGNTFKFISTDKPFFLNSASLDVYNSNFEDMEMPLFHNDSSYNDQSDVSFTLLNSVIYSSNDTVVFNTVYEDKFSETISNCFTNNSNLTGDNVQVNATTSYADLYAEETNPYLSDNAINNLPFIPEKDINGNPRVINGMLDIGAIEFLSTITAAPAIGTEEVIQYYPNPGTDFLNIKVQSNAVLEIFTINGRKISDFPLNQGHNTLPIDQLQDGLYLLTVTSDTNSNQVLFVKK